MDAVDVGTYVATEERSVRRRLAIRGLLTAVLAPVVTVTGYTLAAEAGVLAPEVDLLALVTLSLLSTVVGLGTLVILARTIPMALVGYVLGGALAWGLVTLALEATATGAWLEAVVLATWIVLGPFAVVLATLYGALSAWVEYEAGF